MSTWNYRILREPQEPDDDGRREPDDYYYRVIEVFYDDDGNIDCWGCHAEPGGDSPDELAVDLTHMLAAFVLPILDHADLKAVLDRKDPERAVQA